MAEEKTSGIKWTPLEGDMSVSRHAVIGGELVVRGKGVVGHNLEVGGNVDAENIRAIEKEIADTKKVHEEDIAKLSDSIKSISAGTMPTGKSVYAETAKYAESAGYTERTTHAETADVAERTEYADKAGEADTAESARSIDGKTAEQFLRSDEDDIAEGSITFLQGAKVNKILTFNNAKTEDFSDSMENGRGGAFYRDKSGKLHVQTDYVEVRDKAMFNELEVNKVNAVAGDNIYSSACNRIVAVTPLLSDGEQVGWRCYFKAEDGEDEIANTWKVGYQAYCKSSGIKTLGSSDEFSTRRYWRLVVGVGSEQMSTERKYNYVDLSATLDVEIDGKKGYLGYDPYNENDEPKAGDVIVQLGNQVGSAARFAMGLYVSESSMVFYDALNDFTDVGSRVVHKISPEEVLFSADRFHLVAGKNNEYRETPVLMMGAWTEGAQATHWMSYTYGGCQWLCVLPTGSYTNETPSEDAVTDAGERIWLKTVDKGADGKDAVVYDVIPDTTVVHFNADGVIPEGKITFHLYKTVGGTTTEITGDADTVQMWCEVLDSEGDPESNEGDEWPYTVSWVDNSPYWPVSAKVYDTEGNTVKEFTFTTVTDGANGTDGVAGPQGEKGEKGEKGDQGEKGEAADDVWEIRFLPDTVSLKTDSKGNVTSVLGNSPIGMSTPQAKLYVFKNGEKYLGNDCSIINRETSPVNCAASLSHNSTELYITSINAQTDADGKPVKLGEYAVPCSSAMVFTTLSLILPDGSMRDFDFIIPVTVDISMAWSQQVLTNEKWSSDFAGYKSTTDGQIAQLDTKMQQTADSISLEVSQKVGASDVDAIISAYADKIVEKVTNKLGAAGLTIYTNAQGVPCVKLQGGQIIFADEGGNDCILVSGSGTFAFLADDHKTVAYNLGNKGLPDVIQGSTSVSFTAISGRAIGGTTFTIYALFCMTVGTEATYYRFNQAMLDENNEASTEQAEYDGKYFTTNKDSGSPYYTPTGSAVNGALWVRTAADMFSLFTFTNGVATQTASAQVFIVYKKDGSVDMANCSMSVNGTTEVGSVDMSKYMAIRVELEE